MAMYASRGGATLGDIATNAIIIEQFPMLVTACERGNRPTITLEEETQRADALVSSRENLSILDADGPVSISLAAVALAALGATPRLGA